MHEVSSSGDGSGVDGKSVLNGTTDPSSGTGTNGDFYINTTSHTIFGPKASGTWPTPGTSLIGPTGATGAAGATGATGANGAAGAKGDKGDTGDTGPQGPQGDKGDPGDSSSGIGFDGVTSGTNTTAAMVVGSGASLDVSGTGTINATEINGVEFTGDADTLGKIPIAQGDGTAAWADPLVQGTKAEGEAIDNPVTIGGKDGSGNNKAFAVDSSGRPTVNVNGTVTVTQSGVATSAKQDTGNTSLASIDSKLDDLTTPSDTQPISAASLPLPSGASTSAKQPALGTAGTASTDVITIQGIASMTAVKTDGSGVTQPVSAASLPLPTGAATETTLAAAKSDLDTIAGAVSSSKVAVKASAGDLIVEVSDGANVIGSATHPVQVSLANTATNSTAVKVDGSAVTQPVSGTVTVQQSTASSLKVDLSGTAANSTAIKVDNSAVTQPVKLSPQTSGGLGMPFSASVGATKTAVKTSAGNLYGWQIFNNTAAIAYVQVFNKATGSVTVGTTAPDFVIALPPSSGAVKDSSIPYSFSTAITIACTTGRSNSTGATCDVLMDVN